MPVKHILAPLTGSHNVQVPLCALHLAQSLTAHVSAGFVPTPEHMYPPLYIATPLFQEAWLELRDELKKKARATFDQAIAETLLPIVTKPLCLQASAEWLDQEGDCDPVTTVGPLADIAVIGKPEVNMGGSDWRTVEETLFTIQRPALIVPAGCSRIDLSRPLIAWNGSRQAANAVKAALGLLPTGASISVLQVGSLGHQAISTERLLDDLGWHCLEASVRRVEDKPHRTGEIILQQAKALSCSVIIMGAYTHNRARELVLGGVTNFMLRHVDMPLLLAH